MPASGAAAMLTIPSAFGNITQTRDLATTLGATSTTTWLSFLIKPDAKLPNEYLGIQFGSPSANATNTPPVITSDGVGGTAAINVAENMTAVTTVTATDADLPAQTLTYSISGGADAARFTINSATGVLSFVTAPNFEAPTDAGTNNVYDVTVRVSDGEGGTDTQAISVTVTNTNDTAPVVTPGQLFVFSELATNSTTVGTIAASDADGSATFSGWTITAGNNNGVFSINAATGELSIVDRTNLNFDITPSYVLSVTVSDGINTSTVQIITINVTDSPNNSPVANADTYTLLEGGTLNQTVVSG